MSLRILLADDHQVVREGLRSLLEKQPEMEVVGEAENGHEAVELARELRPDLVILDVSMPSLHGAEAARRILERRPATKILALSLLADRRTIEQLLDAGAAGYLVKSSAFRELLQAISLVTSGRTYLSPRAETALAGRTESAAREREPLTGREREVLQLIAEGLTTRQIADRLFISEKTADTHRQNIMKKLKLHTVAQLTKYALAEGLTPPEP